MLTFALWFFFGPLQINDTGTSVSCHNLIIAQEMVLDADFRACFFSFVLCSSTTWERQCLVIIWVQRKKCRWMEPFGWLILCPVVCVVATKLPLLCARCLFASLCVSIYVCIYVYMHTHTHTHTHTYMCINICVGMYTYTYIYIHIYTYVYVHGFILLW